MNKKIYMDNSATTKIDEVVKEELIKYLEVYGNPGSFHTIGLESKRALANARERIAKILNCKSSELIFTSGGTESINLALKGLAFGSNGKKNKIITTEIEHPAVLETCEFLKKKGFEIIFVKMDRTGLIDMEDLKNKISEETLLVSIMYANNEVGTIQNIKEIGKICKEKNIKLHTDACQAAGYLELNVKELNLDMMTLNSSKVYGPKGIGLLYVKTGIVLEPLIHGGGQEGNKRSGTENLAGIRAFTKALEIAEEQRENETQRLSELRDYMIEEILKKIPKSILNGHPSMRLPNNINISFLDVEGEAILLYLDSMDVYASSGSACTSKTLDPSHVVVALGVPYEYAHGSIRFTLGKDTTKEDIDYVLEILPKIVKDLRKISPFNVDSEKLEKEIKK